MIDRQSSLPIQAQAHLPGISRSAVYYLPAPTPPQDIALMCIFQPIVDGVSS